MNIVSNGDEWGIYGEIYKNIRQFEKFLKKNPTANKVFCIICTILFFFCWYMSENAK